MMQPTTIPAIAPLLIVDELELLLLPVAVGVVELVETVLLLDIKVVLAVDDVDVTELVEEGAWRMLAICFPSPRSQQVELFGPQQ